MFIYIYIYTHTNSKHYLLILCIFHVRNIRANTKIRKKNFILSNSSRSLFREFITSLAFFVHIDLSFLYTWFHRMINGAVPLNPRLRLSRRFYQLGHAVLLLPLLNNNSFISVKSFLYILF